MSRITCYMMDYCIIETQGGYFFPANTTYVVASVCGFDCNTIAEGPSAIRGI